MKYGIYTFMLETHLKNFFELSNFEYGWGQGYVLIPKNHPYYEKDYNDIIE